MRREFSGSECRPRAGGLVGVSGGGGGGSQRGQRGWPCRAVPVSQLGARTLDPSAASSWMWDARPHSPLLSGRGLA